MKALYNKNLRFLAENTALRRAATPLFLCDENLYICMKSIGAEKSIKQPITGSNLEVYMDDSLKKNVLQMDGGWMYGTIYLNSAELETIIYIGTLENEKYYVFMSEEGRLFHSYDEMPGKINSSLQLLNDRIGVIIDELLQSKATDASKLDRNCLYMIRLKRYISVALNESIDKNKYYLKKNENLLSVNVLLDYIFKFSNEILPAYGYHIQYDFHKAELRYCDCSTRSLITLICILLFNTISISDDKIVKVTYLKRTARRILEIELTTASNLGNIFSCGGLAELSELMLEKNTYPFVLELMVSIEITKALGWNIQYVNSGGVFTLKVELPESTMDISRIQIRSNSIERDYTEMLIREFLIDI